MSLKSGSKKKSGSARSGDAGDKDRLIAELKERVAVLENELRQKQSGTISRESTDHGLIEDYLVLFQRMVDEAADMVFLLGPMGRILYVNEAVCKALGYTREELQSMTVFDLNQIHHAGNWQEHEEALKKQGSKTFENSLLTKDGHLIPVEISANYARLGSMEYNYSFVRDITGRKHAEMELRSLNDALAQRVAELREAEKTISAERQRFNDVLETLPAYLILLTPDHQVAFANRFFRERFGESHGRRCFEYLFGHTGPCEDCETYKVLETGQPHRWEWTGPDGRNYDIYDFPFKDVDGSPLIMELGIDITERKLAEIKLEGHQKHLEDLVRERTRKLKEVNIQLQADIAERQRAEEGLRDSQAHVNSIFRAAPTGIGLVVNRVITEANDRLCEMTGYTMEELLGKNARIFYPADEDYEYVGREKYDQINRRGTGTVETRWRRKDGHLIDILLSSTPLEPGNLDAGVTFTALDITERKQAEEKLAYLASFPDLNPNPVIEVDDRYNILYSNPAAQRIFPDLATMASMGAGHPMFEGIMSVMNVPVSEERQMVRDVEINGIYYQQSIYFLPDQNTARIYFVNITERKKFEDALRLTQASVDRAEDGILWVTPDGKVLYANEAMSRSLECTPDELRGMSIWDFDPIYTRETWGKHWQEIKERGSFSIETVHHTKNGREFPVEISVNYVHFGDREFNFAYIKDITERKRAEEELKAAKAQAELYVDLMGHDINNIHQVALGYLELARDMPGDTKDEYLDKATEALKRSTRLISNVRKLQKQRDRPERLRMVDVSEVLIAVSEEHVATSGKTITLDLHGHAHCFVRADDLLHDVFSNLVGNAVKHTGNDAHVSIDLDVDQEHGKKYYRVEVEDDGPGIPDELKKTLFNRSLIGTPRAKGMGLGLYIVRTLVNSYGGRVWAEDRVKGDYTKGARFVVMLPMVKR